MSSIAFKAITKSIKGHILCEKPVKNRSCPNPDCELLGITTVSGQAERRAMLASALCHVAGVHVPIYPGVESPLLTAQMQPTAPQAEALGTDPRHWDHETEFPCGEAIEFLRRTIRRHPGEVTLLSIGPLTNVGLLFSVDPEIPHLLHQYVAMCGRFLDRPDLPSVEWNAGCDPYASAIVYRATAPVHRSIGLDVTTQVRMDRESVRRRFQTTLLRPVLDFAEVWFRRSQEITFHDPLAACLLFDESICVFGRGTVVVELGDNTARGLTRWTADPVGSHEVATEVDTERFFEHYFSMFE